MDRYVCIHGHFYQPPRENPWLEDIEIQDSARPFHNWNERISQECYRQNAASRILDNKKKIVEIVNNYSRMSFNFGPTLLSWMKDHAGNVYDKILEADRLGQERFSGHGPALAQAYNHMILPLSNTEDKHTQVLWGIHDFKSHFRRDPEGMWLPETAADVPTLEVLADHGIRFTILAPRQARRYRKMGSKRWKSLQEEDLDTSKPYLCQLPSGRSIVLFFYHGPLSHQVAYGGLLHSGENLAKHLISAFPPEGDGQCLVHIATDGESFGHHHTHGDMALAYCLHEIETKGLARVTIYGEFLEKCPPAHEVEIQDVSAWSCAHGVDRWKRNCGCFVDRDLAFKQEWRAVLRESLDWLRDHFRQLYVSEMQAFHEDPWQLRNDYIQVIENRSRDNIEAFLVSHVTRELAHDEKVFFLKLLEIQRNAMLMYTSCGWFFDDLAGIEGIQILQYAARAMQLCHECHALNLEPEFKQRLEAAPCNDPAYAHGRQLYESQVEPAQIDLSRVGAHVALSSIFQPHDDDQLSIYCYALRMEGFRHLEAGAQVLITSSATIESTITLQQHAIDLAVLYLGNHHMFGAVRAQNGHDNFPAICKEMRIAFRRGDTNETLRLINATFAGANYSLSHLFRDQQRRILNRLLEHTREEIAQSYLRVYKHNFALMNMMHSLNLPLPNDLATPAAFVLNHDILKQLKRDQVNVQRLSDITEEIATFSLQLDEEQLSYELGQQLSLWMKQLVETPDDVALLEQIGQVMKILGPLAPQMDLQKPQNAFFAISKAHYGPMKKRAESEDATAQRWMDLFQELANHLDLAVSQ